MSNYVNRTEVTGHNFRKSKNLVIFRYGRGNAADEFVFEIIIGQKISKIK